MKCLLLVFQALKRNRVCGLLFVGWLMQLLAVVWCTAFIICSRLNWVPTSLRLSTPILVGILNLVLIICSFSFVLQFCVSFCVMKPQIEPSYLRPWEHGEYVWHRGKHYVHFAREPGSYSQGFKWFNWMFASEFGCSAATASKISRDVVAVAIGLVRV